MRNTHENRRHLVAGAGLLLAALGIPFAALADSTSTRYQVDSSAGTVLDRKTTLTWERGVSTTALSFGEAGSRCAARGEGWRLPGKKELESLVWSNESPTIDSDAFPDAIPLSAGTTLFWTGTSFAGAVGSSWTVNFATGESYSVLEETGGCLVRCVLSN